MNAQFQLKNRLSDKNLLTRPTIPLNDNIRKERRFQNKYKLNQININLYYINMHSIPSINISLTIVRSIVGTCTVYGVVNFNLRLAVLLSLTETVRTGLACYLSWTEFLLGGFSCFTVYILAKMGFGCVVWTG